MDGPCGPWGWNREQGSGACSLSSRRYRYSAPALTLGTKPAKEPVSSALLMEEKTAIVGREGERADGRSSRKMSTLSE
jgi:hypothetical protein